MVESLKATTDEDFRAMSGGVDLNGKMEFRANSGGNTPGAAYEYRQDAVRPTYGFPPMDDLRALRCTLRRRQKRSHPDLRGTVPGHGYTLLQILSVTLFEKMPLQQAFPGSNSSSNSVNINNQLNLFAF